MPWVSSLDGVEREGIAKLLAPLRTPWPEVVEAVLHEVQPGKSPAQAGELLLHSFQAWQAKCQRQSEERLQEESERYEQLQREFDKQASELKQVLSNLGDLERDTVVRQSEIQRLQATITDQNRLLARQHEQLMALLGDAREDSSR